MKVSTVGYLVIAGLLLSTSCSMFADHREGLGLTDTTWTFIGFRTADGEMEGPGAESIWLTFTGEGRIDGNLETNEYHGSYQTDNGRLTIDSTGTTLAGLLPDSKFREYFKALKRAHSYEIDGERLIITYGNNGEALLFEPKK